MGLELHNFMMAVGIDVRPRNPCFYLGSLLSTVGRLVFSSFSAAV